MTEKQTLDCVIGNIEHQLTSNDSAIPRFGRKLQTLLYNIRLERTKGGNLAKKNFVKFHS